MRGAASQLCEAALFLCVMDSGSAPGMTKPDYVIPEFMPGTGISANLVLCQSRIRNFFRHSRGSGNLIINGLDPCLRRDDVKSVISQVQC